MSLPAHMSAALNLPIALTAQRLVLLFLACIQLSACTSTSNAATTTEVIGSVAAATLISDDTLVMPDGAQLPVRIWRPETGDNRAVLIALHGFNDYSNAFSEFAPYLAENFAITTYAYDQRGFGDSANRGSWAGVTTYANDLIATTQHVRAEHPDTPVFVLGVSMGGAVAIVGSNAMAAELVDGIILSAPAVWARSTMPWYQRAALFVAENLLPDWGLTGAGVEVTPSDNIEMLIANGRDPKVIKKTRVEAISGLANLMDRAMLESTEMAKPTLLLVGRKDEIIPNYATEEMIETLPGNFADFGEIKYYDNGYHMLLRDLQRQVVWDDVTGWIAQHIGEAAD